MGWVFDTENVSHLTRVPTHPALPYELTMYQINLD